VRNFYKELTIGLGSWAVVLAVLNLQVLCQDVGSGMVFFTVFKNKFLSY